MMNLVLILPLLTNTHAPHRYDGNLIGDPHLLPRGAKLPQERNDADFFRSVHLGDTEEGLYAEQVARRDADEAAFLERVVVDTLDFKVGHYGVNNNLREGFPCAADRTRDMTGALVPSPISKGQKFSEQLA